jgi:DNA replication protein DnaC
MELRNDDGRANNTTPPGTKLEPEVEKMLLNHQGGKRHAPPSEPIKKLGDQDGGEGILSKALARAVNRPPSSAATNTDADTRRAQQTIARDLGRRYSPERVSLERFEFYHHAQRKVLVEVGQLANSINDLVEAGENIIFFGTVGTGKDYMLAALLHRAAEQGITCRWFNGLELYGALRDRMGDDRREDEFFRGLAFPRVLGISDPIPPANDPTAWNIQALYRLVDRRYRDCKCTWLTMNVETLEQADEQLSVPVLDRLREAAHILPCFWPSYRKRRRA